MWENGTGIDKFDPDPDADPNVRSFAPLCGASQIYAF
jgi:hypothetical protein